MVLCVLCERDEGFIVHGKGVICPRCWDGLRKNGKN